jgi:lipopolysaccharide biosynthesis protein
MIGPQSNRFDKMEERSCNMRSWSATPAALNTLNGLLDHLGACFKAQHHKHVQHTHRKDLTVSGFHLFTST